MDSADSRREQSGVFDPSPPESPTKGNSVGGTYGGNNDRGDREPSSKECTDQSSSGGGRLHECHVSGTQNGWVLASSAESKASKPFCSDSSLQDGVGKVSEELDHARRLVGQAGPKRRIPHGANTPLPSALSQIPVERDNVAVQSVAIWPELGSMYVHEGHETSSGEPHTIGDLANPVPRRYAYPGSVQGETSGTSSLVMKLLISLGFLVNLKKSVLSPTRKIEFLGFLIDSVSMHLSLPRPKVHSIVQLARRMVSKDKVSLRELAREIGMMVAAQPAILPAPLHYRFLESAQVLGTEVWPLLRDTGDGHTRHEKGSGLVDLQCYEPQREGHGDSPVASCYRIRCLEERLGSMLPGDLNGGPMDREVTATQYQLPRAVSSILGTPNICLIEKGHSSLTSHRQCDSDSICQQDGRAPLGYPVRTSSGIVGVVPSTEHPDSCRAPTRERECTCGLGVPPRVGLERLEAGEGSFCGPGSAVWPFVNRPVCITNKPPVASVLQLEARPFSMGSGRIISLVGETQLLHVSPLLSDPKMPQQAESREGLGTTSGSGMAQSSLVPSTTESAGGHTSSITITEGHNHGPNGSVPPLSPGGSSSLGRLACVRRQLQLEGLLDGVVNIIRQSWRNSTEAAYLSAWRMWVRWCCGRGGDPVSAPLSEVLEFLLEQYQAGKQYRTTNSFRSAISMTHEEVDGTRFG